MPEAARFLTDFREDSHAGRTSCASEALVLPGSARELTERISRLRHSWLKNQICCKSADDVAFLWNRGDWAALEHSFELRLDEVDEIARGMEEGFSPRQLVEQLPVLQSLPAKARRDLGSLVHEIHLSGVPHERLRNGLVASASDLRGALKKLRAAWRLSRDDAAAEQAVRAAWKEFIEAAAALHRALGQLPRGVVLP